MCATAVSGACGSSTADAVAACDPQLAQQIGQAVRPVAQFAIAVVAGLVVHADECQGDALRLPRRPAVAHVDADVVALGHLPAEIAGERGIGVGGRQHVQSLTVPRRARNPKAPATARRSKPVAGGGKGFMMMLTVSLGQDPHEQPGEFAGPAGRLSGAALEGGQSAAARADCRALLPDRADRHRPARRRAVRGDLRRRRWPHLDLHGATARSARCRNTAPG